MVLPFDWKIAGKQTFPRNKRTFPSYVLPPARSPFSLPARPVLDDGKVTASAGQERRCGPP